jgi:hypothetical protein
MHELNLDSYQLRELCYIVYRRNLIEAKRNRARYKIYYYQAIKRRVEAWSGQNSSARRLKAMSQAYNAAGADVEAKQYDAQLATLESTFAWLRTRGPKPQKWIDAGAHEINRLILKHMAAYTKTKYDAMTHTKKTHRRTLLLLKSLGLKLIWRNGSVDCIVSRAGQEAISSKAYIKKLHDEWLAEKAITKMLTKETHKDGK